MVRILNDFGVNLPLQFADVGVCLLVCDGICNAVLYGYTRNIFRKVFTKLKNGEGEYERKLMSPMYGPGDSDIKINQKYKQHDFT